MERGLPRTFGGFTRIKNILLLFIIRIYLLFPPKVRVPNNFRRGGRTKGLYFFIIEGALARTKLLDFFHY